MKTQQQKYYKLFRKVSVQIMKCAPHETQVFNRLKKKLATYGIKAGVTRTDLDDMINGVSKHI